MEDTHIFHCQWRHQKFSLWEVLRGKMHFWGGKNPKICWKWLIFAIFFFKWGWGIREGSGGTASNGGGGKCTLMFPLLICIYEVKSNGTERHTDPLASGGTRIFLWGNWGGKMHISEEAKIQKIPENGWFLPFFSSNWGGGKWGTELPKGGEMLPLAPSLIPPLSIAEFCVQLVSIEAP